MALLSGTGGTVKIGSSTLAEITAWSLDTNVNITAFGSNSSAGFQKRVAGTKGGTGTLAGKLDTADPIRGDLKEGDSVTLLLHINATAHFIVPAVIESVSISVDVDTGEAIGWTATFGTNGAWTEPTYS